MKIKRLFLILVTLSIAMLAGIGLIRHARKTAQAQASTLSYRNSLLSYSDRFERIGDSPPRERRRYTELQFVSINEAWLLCDTSLWRTVNGGKSWEEVWNIAESRHSMPRFYFLTSSIGWRYSVREIAKTSDGGRTWNALEIPAFLEIVHVYFADENKGWLAGSDDRLESSAFPQEPVEREPVGMPVVFSTLDGGKTWSQQNLNKGSIGPVAHDLTVAGKRLWVSAGVHLLYLEDDHWKLVDYLRGNCARDGLMRSTGMIGKMGNGVAPVQIHFAGENDGWLVFPNGYLAKSCDGGKTWCDLFTFRDSQDRDKSLVKVYFKDALHGWGLDNRGNIYESIDGGANWLKLENESRFDDMYFLDADHGWAIAKEGLFLIKP